MKLLLCLLIMFTTMATSDSRQCKDDVIYSKRGKYLKNHVISSGSAADIGDCLVKCASESRCKSINFRFEGLFCELNDADRYSYPWDYGSGSMWHAYSDYYFKPTFREYHMTPLWLKAHASYIDSSHSMADHQITFERSALENALLLKVPLVAAGELSDETPLNVEITVDNDASIGQTYDSDINYGLSDGTNFTGFLTVDALNYDTHAPSVGIQATSGASLTDIKQFSPTSPIGGNRAFPDQFVFTFKLDKPWGSCFIAHDGGFTNTVEYSERLKLSRGLILEVYKSNKGEKVGIKSIKVTIRKTDS